MANEKGIALNNKIEKMVEKAARAADRSDITRLDGYEIDSIDLEALRSEITAVWDTFSLEGTPEYKLREGIWYIANWKVDEVCGKYQLDIRLEIFRMF